MRWPWVTTRCYLDTVRHANIRVDGLLADLRAEKQRSAELLAKYHELAGTLATLVAPKQAAPLESAPVDLVFAAITRHAGNSRALRVVMSREAMRMRQAGYEDADIIQAIEAGITAPEGLPA
jgi:hypothetical protein